MIKVSGRLGFYLGSRSQNLHAFKTSVELFISHTFKTSVELLISHTFKVLKMADHFPPNFCDLQRLWEPCSTSSMCHLAKTVLLGSGESDSPAESVPLSRVMYNSRMQKNPWCRILWTPYRKEGVDTEPSTLKQDKMNWLLVFDTL